MPSIVIVVVTAVVALIVGAGLGWAWQRSAVAAARVRETNLQENLAALRCERDGLAEALSACAAELGTSQQETATLRERLAQQARTAQEKIALLDEAQRKLGDAFGALSAKALSANNESFLKLARENLSQFQQGAKADLDARQKAIDALTKPISERLEKFDGKLGELEKSRVGAYREIHQQINDLVKNQLPQLHRETSDLVRALRQPQARGRWGEVQLRRVVEMAGMLEHCDFDEQVSRDTEDGRRRPDLIVHLPGGRQVVVDAKAPVQAYLDAVEAADDSVRQTALVRHARQVRDHVTALSRKSYFAQFDPSPEFVVLFVPGEAFFSAALTQDPNLIEYGAESRVIPASPTTLIALLKAVAYGWRQEALAKNAQEVAALGHEVYDRIGKLAEHWRRVGQRLNQAVEAYNSSVGTLESRVLPATRKFRDLQATGTAEEIEAVETITRETRELTAEELRPTKDGQSEPDALS